MRWMIIAAIWVLAGCTGEAERAAERYNFLLRNGGSAEERCAAAGAVADAYADAEDADGYQDWKATASIECLRASTRP